VEQNRESEKYMVLFSQLDFASRVKRMHVIEEKQETPVKYQDMKTFGSKY
jgi:hypothetical protein